ncbi:hypothetical protein PC118_g1997 [Phytophthora cactorum]|uniref:Uncharacterized protein n=1 Tax=Phytophthora cactorum TaxID=29920 RepID=A0A8T1GHY7_9STRA|nr:hypothetical protein PC118_g1997 [Phytophthora cactorum]
MSAQRGCGSVPLNFRSGPPKCWQQKPVAVKSCLQCKVQRQDRTAFPFLQDNKLPTYSKQSLRSLRATTNRSLSI